MTQAQLDLLLQATNISGDGVIGAMVDHLVRGKSKSASAADNHISPSQITRALKALGKVNEIMSRLAAFY